MKVYDCQKCGRSFNYKSSYTRHLKRKTPCNKNLNEKVEEINTTTDM